MEASHVRSFLNQHCRFKLRSGKIVYGVIWAEPSGQGKEYYFSTVSEHQRLNARKDFRGISEQHRVNLEDIIMAERISG